MPGVHDLLACVARLGLRLGLASNSQLASIRAALEGLGIRKQFGAVASGTEVPHGKPHPAVYRLALDRLGLQPDAAIAIEDSQAGLTAAKAAGLYCLVVPSELTEGQDLRAADRRFTSLHEVAAWLSGFAASRER